jgi:hypothetical protein
MLKQLSDFNDYFYKYCLAKILLYSASCFCIFLRISSGLFMPSIAIISSVLDLLVLTALVRYFFFVNLDGGKLGRFFLIVSCASLLSYPLAWDDLSYGLTLPQAYLVQNSFSPISEYGVFTYFPFVEYGRTALSFAFGNKLQIILYRLEGLTLYLITFASLLQIGKSVPSKSSKTKFTYLYALFLMTTVSAFSVYAFVKPESFTTTCFAIATLMFINGKSSKAIISAAVAIPFKYTAVISGLPIVILALFKVRNEISRIKFLEIFGCATIFFVSALWLFNNFQFTSSPFYPLMMSIFPYSGDGVMNSDEYRRVIETLLNQQDVSPKSIVSFKYLKYITTQLGGTLLFLPIFPLLFFKRYLSDWICSRLNLLAIASSIALLIFLLILFSEFRYIYILICIISMSVLIFIEGRLKEARINYFFKFIVFLICLQLIFVFARNYKNSIYDSDLSFMPINLSSEQREEIDCIKSMPNTKDRVASFEQTFYYWKSPFFFIHELNEYIGLNPSQQNLKYAFQKFQVKFILLRDEYKDSLFLASLKIGGFPRSMPQSVLGIIFELYDLREVKIDACINTHIYELLPK